MPTPVPPSIDATGATDVTDQLQTFFNQLPKGATIDFAPTAVYRCEDTVTLGAKTAITLNFNYSRLVATTLGYRERTHLAISGCKGIRIVKPDIKGANPHSGLDAAAYNPLYEAQHGIRIWQSVGVVIDRPRITNVWGDWLYVGRKNPHNPWSSWVHVNAPYCRDNGRIGMSIIAAAVVGVTAPDFDRMRRSVFDIEPDSNSDGAYAVVVDGAGKSRIGKCHTGYLFASKGSAGPVENILFRGLRLVGHDLNAQVVSPEGSRSKRNIRFEGNRTDQTSERTPLRFTRVDGVTVKGNTIPMKRGVPALATTDCTNVSSDI